MSENPILNLDQIAALHAMSLVTGVKSTQDAQKPVDTLERLTTKTLGVLQQQGVYAMLLFLHSRTGDEASIAPIMRRELYRLLQKIPLFAGETVLANLVHQDGAKASLDFYANKVLGDLDTLLVVRDLYEQMLIYARYEAKAEGG